MPIAFTTQAAHVVAMGPVPILFSTMSITNLIVGAKDGVDTTDISKSMWCHHILQHPNSFVRISPTI